jgi:hypothetical protein
MQRADIIARYPAGSVQIIAVLGLRGGRKRVRKNGLGAMMATRRLECCLLALDLYPCHQVYLATHRYASFPMHIYTVLTYAVHSSSMTM